MPGEALVDNGALLETCEVEFALDASKPFKANVVTNGVCALSTYRYPSHLLSLHTTTDDPDPGCRLRVVYADTPSREARLHILAERPHWASTYTICSRLEGG